MLLRRWVNLGQLCHLVRREEFKLISAISGKIFAKLGAPDSLLDPKDDSNEILISL